MLEETIKNITSSPRFTFHIRLLELHFTNEVIKYIIDQVIACGGGGDGSADTTKYILCNIPGIMEEAKPHRQDLMNIYKSVLNQYMTNHQ